MKRVYKRGTAIATTPHPMNRASSDITKGVLLNVLKRFRKSTLQHNDFCLKTTILFIEQFINELWVRE